MTTRRKVEAMSSLPWPGPVSWGTLVSLKEALHSLLPPEPRMGARWVAHGPEPHRARLGEQLWHQWDSRQAGEKDVRLRPQGPRHMVALAGRSAQPRVTMLFLGRALLQWSRLCSTRRQHVQRLDRQGRTAGCPHGAEAEPGPQGKVAGGQGPGTQSDPRRGWQGSASPLPSSLEPHGLLPADRAAEARPPALGAARRQLCHTCAYSPVPEGSGIQGAARSTEDAAPWGPSDVWLVPADWPGLLVTGIRVPQSRQQPLDVPSPPTWSRGPGRPTTCLSRRPHSAPPCTHQTGRQSASSAVPGCRLHRAG